LWPPKIWFKSYLGLNTREATQHKEEKKNKRKRYVYAFSRYIA
jgi:hypothetical protein